MSQSTPRDRAASLLKFLGERVELFERFHSANYKLACQGFFDFFDRDDVIGEVQKALSRRAPTSAKAWYERANQSGAVPPLPDGPAEAFAMRYALLKHVRMDKVDLRYFSTNHFPGGFLDEKLMNYKRLVVHPFAADCRTLARLATARLEDEWVDVGALTDEVLDSDEFAAQALGPRAWTDEGDQKVEAAEKAAKRGFGGAGKGNPGRSEAAVDPLGQADPETGRPRSDPGSPAAGGAKPSAPAPVAPAPPPAAPDSGAQDPGPEADAQALSEALAALEAAASEGEGNEADDLRKELLALRVELGRGTRRPARIAARLDALAAHAALAEAVDGLRETLGE